MFVLSADNRIVFLYSEPLTGHDDDGNEEPVIALDFESEREAIFNSLEEAGRAIEARVEAATVDNLRTLTTLGFSAIHYSGHGDPDFLAFEDGTGGTHEFDGDLLESLFAAGGTTGVQLAFVSACYSRAAGDAFVDAGVPHVIAVRLEEPVYDVAAKTFARAFYLALLTNKTVADAFAIGRSSVSAIKGLPAPATEAEKFLLLPADGDHDVALFGDALPGTFADITPEPPKTNLPANAEYFTGRNIEMHEAVSNVLKGRLTTLKGAPGIGKTALATATGHYLNERRTFDDGVFFVSLRGAVSSEAARAAIATAVGLEASNEEELMSALQQRETLLILDNCEDPLHEAPGDFRKLIALIMQGAPKLRLLITSRQAIGGGLPGIAEKVVQVGRLAAIDGARLFLRLSPRRLTNADLAVAEGIDPVKALSEHPVLQYLAGHPHAISLAVPLLQDKTLGQLSDLLKSQNVDALLVADVPPDELDVMTSFAKSLAVSVRYVRERDPNSIKLFAVMGLLPGGAIPSDIDEIWGKDWRHPMDLLVRSSLVERFQLGEVEHFTTFPFVTAYAAKLLADDDLSRFAIRACEHYSRFADTIQTFLGRSNAANAYALFALEEENLWACLDASRPGRAKRDGEEASPIAVLTSLFPQLLNLSGRAHDAARAAEQGLEACRRLNDPEGEASALSELGEVKRRAGDMEESQQYHEAALRAFEKLGATAGQGYSHRALGLLKQGKTEPDLEGAKQSYQKAISLFGVRDDLPSRIGLAIARGALGSALADGGDYDDAIVEYREELALDIRDENVRGVAITLAEIAQVAQMMQRFEDCALLLEEAMHYHRAVADLRGQAADLFLQGEVFLKLPSLEGSIAAYWQAQQLYVAMDDPGAGAINPILERLIANGAPGTSLPSSESEAQIARLGAINKVRASSGDHSLYEEVMAGIPKGFGAK